LQQTQNAEHLDSNNKLACGKYQKDQKLRIRFFI